MPEIASVLERPTILPANEEKPEVGQKLFSGRRAVAKGVLTRRHVFAAHGVFSYAKGNGRGVARVTVAGARPRQGSIRPRLRHRSVPSRPSRRTCIFLPSGHVCLLVKRGRSANLASGLAPTHTHTHTHTFTVSLFGCSDNHDKRATLGTAVCLRNVCGMAKHKLGATSIFLISSWIPSRPFGGNEN